MKRIAPSFGAASFSCPHCGAVAHHDWFDLRAGSRGQQTQTQLTPYFIDFLSEHDEAEPKMFPMPAIGGGIVRADFNSQLAGMMLSRCFSCRRLGLWVSKRLAWPPGEKLRWPNEDLPPEAKRDFEEAEAIHTSSPRGAAALLRLAVQRICNALEPTARDLNDAIGKMVGKGLSVQVQQALDVVRVIGNNAVHPGSLDVKDDPQTVSSLFDLINIIADTMITQPKKVAALYATLPSGALAGIDKRDGRSVVEQVSAAHGME